MCCRIVSPPGHLWKTPDAVNFFPLGTARDYYLIVFSVFGGGHQRNCSRRCHLLVSLIVAADPDCFLIGNATVYANDRAFTSTLQFSQQLMGNIEAPSYWHGVDAARPITLLPNTRDAASKYGLYVLL